MKKEQETANSAPVEELSDKFSKDSIMRSKRFAHRRDALSFLLKDGDSFLEHSTSCFEYRQEFTRFHLFFFTGDSLEYLCRKCGLVSELVANEEREPGHQYISYRFYDAGR